MKRLCAALAIALAACSSPESRRTRGAGPGADIGNRGDAVRMHEGSRPFHGTPRLVTGEPPPLEPASHAREVARR